MKIIQKVLVGVIIIMNIVFMIACKQEINYEDLLNKVSNHFSFPTEITSDLEFPNNINIDGNEIVLEWNSSDEKVITIEGKVIRPKIDTLITLEVNATIDGQSQIIEIAKVLVLKVESEEFDYDTYFNSLFTSFKFPSEVSNDLEFPSSYIDLEKESKLVWKTSSDSISSDGKIKRESKDVKVTITLKATVDGLIKEREIATVTVLKENSSDEKEYTGELILFNKEANYLEVTNSPCQILDSQYKVYCLKDNEKVEINSDSFLVGMENVTVKVNDKKIVEVIIPSDYLFSKIRVAIRESINDIADERTLYHDSITMTLPSDTIAITSDGEKKQDLKAGTCTISCKDGNVIISNNGVNFVSSTRVIIQGTSKEITLNSVKRNSDSMYSGSFDISVVNNRLLLINEVELDDYVCKVLPSEMPTSWNMEALKAQAVAARTYAYKAIYDANALKEGYVVDDSTSSQVYNNVRTNDRAIKAATETAGLVMFNNNEPIVAYYFSASCGLTASGKDVWIKDHIIDEIPYLIGKNLTLDGNDEPLVADTSDENSMLDFFKTIYMESPGGNSSLHRWKITFTKEQLRNTINANLPIILSSAPTAFPQYENEEWVNKDFPSDIGEIKNITVCERGTSGVVVSLLIITEKITFKIINQYNIRFTIRGRDAGSECQLFAAKANRTDYSPYAINPSILNSGFFALEWDNDNLTFYGGGNGHGCGMDQYGANYYAECGYDYQTILKTYYTNIEFINTNK